MSGAVPGSGDPGLPVYRLGEQRAGTALFGLAMPQVLLVAAAAAAVLLPVSSGGGRLGFFAGMVTAAGLGLLAFFPAGGRPLHEMVPTVGAFAWRWATGRHRWAAPLPLLTGTASTTAGAGRSDAPTTEALPRCLSGLSLVAVARPDWAGGSRTVAPVGLVRDRGTSAVTVVVPVRGGPFSLAEPGERHRRLLEWAQVLSQFARESSPVVRLGWSLWSAPTSLDEHLDWVDAHSADGDGDRGPAGDVRVAYRRLVADAASASWRHDLRLWLTVDARRVERSGASRTAPDAAAADIALAAAKALSDRCGAAGLIVFPPMSPVEIAEAARAQADPAAAAALTGVRRGLAQRAGLASVHAIHAGPLAVEARWDALRVDGAWHRVFWVAQWPALAVDADWLEPLLLAPPCVRALAVVMEPISLRASRRRINSESVSIEGQLHLRERHAFRVPVHLQRAHAEVDQREAELHAGFCEYGYLALVCVTGRDLGELDAGCHALIDQAAQCGITELRPVWGRQEAAWACTLPIGRAPDRRLLDGRLS